jgi:signal transduction histidine kinase
MTRVPVEESSIDPTLRRVVIALRLLAWGWMMMLIVIVLIDDIADHPEVVVGASALVTVWTAFFLWVAQSHARLRSLWFVVADGAVILLLGAASTLSGSEDLFHGGMLISWLAVAAYAGGLTWSLGAALLLTIEQAIVHDVDNRGSVGAFGSVVFFVMAILLGWAFDAVRQTTQQLLDTEHSLSLAEQENARRRERERLANRLHDSVLQTLLVIKRDADDPDHVRFLARRQERELRQTIEEYRMPHRDSFMVAISAVRDDVEDVHRVEVNAVLRGDAPMDDRLRAVIRATREALTNAAKHSGSASIDLYAAADDRGVQVAVRDRGVGFEMSRHERHSGLEHSIRKRIETAGGSATVRSVPGQGTEIVIEMETE